MKFLADMGVSPRTVLWLRESCGCDAIHLYEQGLERLPDVEILAKARAEDRILLTMDLDFAQLLALSQDQTPSMILFRLSEDRPELVNQRLEEILQQYPSELETGAIISVTDSAVRVRSLPI